MGFFSKKPKVEVATVWSGEGEMPTNDPRAGLIGSVSSCEANDHLNTIEKILLSKTERRIFGIFMREDFCPENYAFWRKNPRLRSFSNVCTV